MFSLLSVLIMGSVVMIRVGSVLPVLPAVELARIQSELVVMIGLCALGIIIASIIIGFFFGKNLTEPVIRLNDLFKQMALGEVDFDLEEWADFEAKHRDELGAMLETFRMMADNRRLHVDIVAALAKGDLTVAIEPQSRCLIGLIKRSNSLICFIRK